jgi:histidyl-tRNA synthetase
VSLLIDERGRHLLVNPDIEGRRRSFLEFASIKGFKDILPGETERWQRLEATARRVFRSYGFKEINPPLLERTELFSRSIGADTDIVAKEMYSFTDSKGNGMTLRPEATASVVRAYIQHRLYQKDPVQKLFTIGPMFRHERPQKGRFRQFHQINAEILGDPGPKSDADLIVMVMGLLKMMGLTELSLQLNSLGCPDCRAPFRQALKNYLAQKIDSLCADCRRRAETNPLRVFDCKVETCKEVVTEAPSMIGFLCDDCRDHFKSLQQFLGDYDIHFVLNHRLVRGLDYYNRTTFEIQTERLGAQNAVTGGGRYDGLVKILGGPDQSAIGFAMGIERLVELLQDVGQRETAKPDLFVAGLGETAEKKVFNWVNDLRRDGLWVEMAYASTGLKGQMKRADRLGAKKVLIIGDDELDAGMGILRDMATKEQTEVPLDNLIEVLKKELE